MAACEKCWRDAGGDPDRYDSLVKQRNESGNECTPEQQAGSEDAEICPSCKRKTIHLYTHKCMNTNCAIAVLNKGEVK